MIPSRKLSKNKINFNTWNYDKQHQRDTMQRQEIYSFTFWLDPRKSNCMFILIVRYNWYQLPQTQGSVSYERWWIFRCRTSKIFKIYKYLYSGRRRFRTEKKVVTIRKKVISLSSAGTEITLLLSLRGLAKIEAIRWKIHPRWQRGDKGFWR